MIKTQLLRNLIKGAVIESNDFTFWLSGKTQWKNKGAYECQVEMPMMSTFHGQRTAVTTEVWSTRLPAEPAGGGGGLWAFPEETTIKAEK